MALIVLPTTVPVLTVALISVGVGIGLGVSVVLDLAVLGSGPRDAGVTASVNTVTRIIGSALGSQVATAVVIIAAPPLASGSRLTVASTTRSFCLLATLVALAAMWIIPLRDADPVPLTHAPKRPAQA